MKLSEIIALIKAELHSSQPQEDKLRDVSGIAALDKAKATELTFLTKPKWRKHLSSSQALGLITAEVVPEFKGPQLIHSNPYWAMAKIAGHFFSYSHEQQGISELAFIHPEAEIDAGATVFPFAYISAKCRIAAGVVIYPQCYLGTGVQVGLGTVIFPGVCLMDGTIIKEDCIIHAGSILGADGFGFAPGEEDIAKIPQIGNVIIEKDVEIGALCTIDRATFDSTRVGKGSKLDSQVHVAHNVQVGEENMLCAQSGIAGSSQLGRRVILAGQAGVAPGIKLGDSVVLGARCGAIESNDTPGEYLGMPATPLRDWFRQAAALRRLPDFLKRLNLLEKKIESGVKDP